MDILLKEDLAAPRVLLLEVPKCTGEFLMAIGDSSAPSYVRAVLGGNLDDVYMRHKPKLNFAKACCFQSLCVRTPETLNPEPLVLFSWHLLGLADSAPHAPNLEPLRRKFQC